MKSILIGEEKKYPRLKVAKDGTVVLFTGVQRGMVVHVPELSKSCNYVGENANDWNERLFEDDLHGKVILSN